MFMFSTREKALKVRNQSKTYRFDSTKLLIASGTTRISIKTYVTCHIFDKNIISHYYYFSVVEIADFASFASLSLELLKVRLTL